VVGAVAVAERKYSVVKAGDELRCSCPDYEARGQACKHAYAVEFVIRRETAPDGTVTETPPLA